MFWKIWKNLTFISQMVFSRISKVYMSPSFLVWTYVTLYPALESPEDNTATLEAKVGCFSQRPAHSAGWKDVQPVVFQNLLFSLHVLYIVTYLGLWSTNTNSKHAFLQISWALSSREWCSPRTHLTMPKDFFSCQRCYWNPVGKKQGCFSPSYNA